MVPRHSQPRGTRPRSIHRLLLLERTLRRLSPTRRRGGEYSRRQSCFRSKHAGISQFSQRVGTGSEVSRTDLNRCFSHVRFGGARRPRSTYDILLGPALHSRRNTGHRWILSVLRTGKQWTEIRDSRLKPVFSTFTLQRWRTPFCTDHASGGLCVTCYRSDICATIWWFIPNCRRRATRRGEHRPDHLIVRRASIV